MQHTIRGSDVFVKEDLRAIIDALDIAARQQPVGCWRDGWMAATTAMRTAVGIAVEEPEIVTVTERYERYERTEQRSPAPAMPERRFAIRGEREAWPAVEDAAPVNMSGDDVNITLFNPTKGRLVTRQIGHAWLGNDGYQAYWNASDWQRVTVEEARAWGNLVPDDWLVLVRHAYANDKRRQLGQSVRVLERDRRLLR